MAYIKDEDYKEISHWVCPLCKVGYRIKRYDIRVVGGAYPKYLFCDKGCARYFTPNGQDITRVILGGDRL